MGATGSPYGFTTWETTHLAGGLRGPQSGCYRLALRISDVGDHSLGWWATGGYSLGGYRLALRISDLVSHSLWGATGSPYGFRTW